jgi:hypothetical protein
VNIRILVQISQTRHIDNPQAPALFPRNLIVWGAQVNVHIGPTELLAGFWGLTRRQDEGILINNLPVSYSFEEENVARYHLYREVTMSSRVHGVLSTVLIGVAVAVAAVVLFGITPGLGAGYLALSAAGMLCIVYAFCAKCPCKVRCGHVLPGLIARLFPRQPGPYARWEIALMLVGLVLIVGLPLFWLWQNVAALVVFVVLNIFAVWDITRFVCRACDNIYCPMKLGVRK